MEPVERLRLLLPRLPHELIQPCGKPSKETSMAEYTGELRAIANGLAAIVKELKIANAREKERDRLHMLDRQKSEQSA